MVNDKAKEANIVVIENDGAMRDLFTLSLKREGWQIFCSPYDQINLAILEQQHPALIILDFNARDGEIGWDFLQTLKMDDKSASIPVLITTTAAHLSQEIQSYLLTRHISVIYKPFDLNTLLSLVQQTITLAGQSGLIFSPDRTLPILLVEDIEELRDTLATILRFENYRVVTADNGLVALDTVSRADYCLILLDIAMPVMNGIEFLRAYDRQLRPHTPVIILSGETDIPIRTLPSFVVDVLLKPVGVRDLLSLVEKYAEPV